MTFLNIIVSLLLLLETQISTCREHHSPSRILWFFPEPVFSKMRETILTPSECVVVETFKGHLGSYILIVFYDQFLSLQYLFYNFITSLVSLIKTIIVINTTLVQFSDKVWWQNESKKNKQFSLSFTLHKFSINFFLEMARVNWASSFLSLLCVYQPFCNLFFILFSTNQNLINLCNRAENNGCLVAGQDDPPNQF